MTVVLTIPVSGRKKRDLIEMAFGLCGQSGVDFDFTPEEMTDALRTLDTLMAEHPFNLMGYEAGGLPEDPSGLAQIDVPAVYHELAVRLAASKGAALLSSVTSRAAMTLSSAYSRYATIPTALIAPNTPRGSGSSWARRTPFITETE